MATRMFLKLGDVKGACGDDAHPEWIEVSSFSYAVNNSINCVEKAQGNPGGEACTHADLVVTKAVDKASPQLYAYGSVGKMWPKAELEVFEEADLLFKVTLENTAISSMSIGGGTGGIPDESIALGHSKITWQFRDGAEQYWDEVANKGSLDK
jgi:type VI secretion system secreted protein Hcp